MKVTTLLLGGTFLLAGATLFAHHLDAGLSSVLGDDALTEVLFVAKSGKVGVVPHVVGTDAPEIAVTPHTAFTVTDSEGNTESVTVFASTFADPAQVDPHDLVAALGAQLTLADMVIVDDSVVIRGKEGGSASSLTLTDGSGGLLAGLGISSGTTTGSDDIELSISIPQPEGHHHTPAPALAQHGYYLLLSTTEGVTNIGGQQIPFAFDKTTALGLRAVNLGLLPGFFGQLDDNEDALVTFDTALLEKFFPTGLPAKLFVSYVVIDPDLSKIEFASNRFDVVFAD